MKGEATSHTASFRVGSSFSLPEVIRSLGHSPATVFAAAGVDPALYRHPENRISAESLGRLFTCAARTTQRPDLGLLVASSFQPSGLGTGGRTCGGRARRPYGSEEPCPSAPIQHSGRLPEILSCWHGGDAGIRFAVFRFCGGELHLGGCDRHLPALHAMALRKAVEARGGASQPSQAIEPTTVSGLLRRADPVLCHRRRDTVLLRLARSPGLPRAAPPRTPRVSKLQPHPSPSACAGRPR